MPDHASPRRCGRADLAAVPLFGGLGGPGRERLLREARVEDVAEGTCLQFAGRESDHLVVVLTGGLRVVHAEPGGHTRVVRLLGPGDHVGEIGFVLGLAPVHSAFATGASTVCTVPFDTLEGLVRDHPPLVRDLLVAAHRRLLAAELLLSSEATDDVLTRLVSYLLGLPGPVAADGRRRVRLPGSQVDVASFLGTTPETLSRRIHELLDSGALVRLGHGEFTLDVAALTRPLGDRGAM